MRVGFDGGFELGNELGGEASEAVGRGGRTDGLGVPLAAGRQRMCASVLARARGVPRGPGARLIPHLWRIASTLSSPPRRFPSMMASAGSSNEAGDSGAVPPATLAAAGGMAGAGPTLETLAFDNLALRALPVDPIKENHPRQVVTCWGGGADSHNHRSGSRHW